ncbi:MAG TPA: hypothetical protein VG389_19450 [Myxococcota bacterium]|nr:hypothetical protein [Myxococcota bacterium]
MNREACAALALATVWVGHGCAPVMPGYAALEDCIAPGDEDGDGVEACFDPDCFGHPTCPILGEDCTNGYEDDGDGLVDCLDSECAPLAVCTGGGDGPGSDAGTGGGGGGGGGGGTASGVGAACTGGAGCSAGTACLDELSTGFPGGYCSAPCAAGCGAGATCVAELDLCLQTCGTTADCRAGYACWPDSAGGPGTCFPLCDTDADCPDTGLCNAYVGFCGYPPRGAGGVGAACTVGDDCESLRCLTDADGFPGGYCYSLCDAAAGLCPGDGACTPVSDGLGVCMDGCASGADCRSGYVCDPSYATCNP